MSLDKRAGGWLVLILLALTANAILHVTVDDNISHGWPSNSVRNWQEYGFGALKGKLVQNPGGFEAVTKPDIYTGHRPASLYLLYVVNQMFGWTQTDVLPFYLVLSFIIGISTWSLVGQRPLAGIAAAAALLCPGFTIYILDPTVLSVLMAIPYAALLLPQLEKPKLSIAMALLLFALTFCYTMQNWTAVFGLGVIFGYLLARRIPRPRLALFVAMAAVSAGAIAVASLVDKLGAKTPGPGGSGGFAAFLGGYTWGNTGYGINLTTSKAFIRLAAVGFISLLPLHCLLGYLFLKRFKSNGRKSCLVLLPVVFGVLGIATMRNVYGHHPWISPPIIMTGLILSIRLLVMRDAPVVAAEPPGARRGGILWPATFLVACFAYAFLVTLMYRSHNGQFLSMIELVRKNTARTDAIVLLENLDPKMAAEPDIIAMYSDRRVIVLRDLADSRAPREHAFVLSLTDVAELPLVKKAAAPRIASWPVIRELLEFYKTKIARRNPENLHFTAPEPYRLYQLSAP